MSGSTIANLILPNVASSPAPSERGAVFADRPCHSGHDAPTQEPSFKEQLTAAEDRAAGRKTDAPDAPRRGEGDRPAKADAPPAPQEPRAAQPRDPACAPQPAQPQQEDQEPTDERAAKAVVVAGLVDNPLAALVKTQATPAQVGASKEGPAAPIASVAGAAAKAQATEAQAAAKATKAVAGKPAEGTDAPGPQKAGNGKAEAPAAGTDVEPRPTAPRIAPMAHADRPAEGARTQQPATPQAAPVSAEDSQRAPAGRQQGPAEAPGATRKAEPAVTVAQVTPPAAGGETQRPASGKQQTGGSSQPAAAPMEATSSSPGPAGQPAVAAVSPDGAAQALRPTGAENQAPRPAGAEAQAPAEPAALREAGEGSVARQIGEQIRANASRLDQQIIIRLNPPELGRVRMTLRAEGNELRGVLEADNPRTVSELQREAAGLAARLAEGGVALRRLDVSLSEVGGQNSATSTLLHDQPNDGRGTWEQPGRGAADGARAFAEDAAASEPASYVDDQSINVWI